MYDKNVSAGFVIYDIGLSLQLTIMKIRITLKSINKKLGEMPTPPTERKSCPDSCPLKNGDCYGEKYHTSMIWSETETGINKRWGKKFSNSWNDSMTLSRNLQSMSGHYDTLISMGFSEEMIQLVLHLLHQIQFVPLL